MSSPEPIQKRSSLPVVAGVLALGLLLLGGGLALRAYFPAPEEPEAPAEEPVAVGTEAPAPEAGSAEMPEPTAASAADVESLKASIGDFSSRLDQVQARVAQANRPGTEADLKPIQDRLEEMARSTQGLADLPKKVDDLAGRVDGFERKQAEFADEIAQVREMAKAPAEPPAGADGASLPTATGDADKALTEGMALFKQNQFAKALEQFKKATEANPDDARGWYFAALSHGFATSQWSGGDTERFVKRGIEQEKAGEPARPVIDEAFADLSAAQGKAWIVGYRKQAVGR